MSWVNQADGALVRTAAKIADKIRDALVSAVDADRVATDFYATFNPGDSITPGQAADWAMVHVYQNLTQLESVLETVYAQGYVLGNDFGLQAIHEASKVKADNPTGPGVNPQQPTTFDWATWVPGHAAAQALVKPKGGLAKLLSRAKPATIKSVSDTDVNRIGRVLADGLAVGATDLTIAKSVLALDIKSVLEDPQRALTIATTEMNRAMSVAALDTYAEFGLERYEWFALEGCDDCELNAEQGPIEIGSEFQSGDTEPPAHPNCRCSLLPFVEGDSTAVRGDAAALDGADTMDVVDKSINKSVPGPLEVERALSRLEILPNPNHPELKKPEKWVESPWPVASVPTIDPNVWDDAKTTVVDLNDLVGTDPWMKRKNVRKHIESMGQALTPNRSWAMIAEVDGKQVIIDGHHRLFAIWLLGQETAPAYLAVIK